MHDYTPLPRRKEVSLQFRKALGVIDAQSPIVATQECVLQRHPGYCACISAHAGEPRPGHAGAAKSSGPALAGLLDRHGPLRMGYDAPMGFLKYVRSPAIRRHQCDRDATGG
jgi:hypothetical protein